jgi:hypothetical protein
MRCLESSESWSYISPIEDDDVTPIDHIIVGDIMEEVRPRGEYGSDVVFVRSFQLITNPTLPNYSGVDYLAVKGRIAKIVKDEAVEEWVIESAPSNDAGDGMTRVKTIRKLRHEIGNPKVRSN